MSDRQNGGAAQCVETLHRAVKNFEKGKKHRNKHVTSTTKVSKCKRGVYRSAAEVAQTLGIGRQSYRAGRAETIITTMPAQSFKAELIEKGVFESFKDTYTEIFDYLEIYYNRKRRHPKMDYEIPVQFEQKKDATANNSGGDMMKYFYRHFTAGDCIKSRAVK